MSDEQELPRRSPALGDPSFLTVARVARPHGAAGDLACEIITEFPQRFRRVKHLYLAAARSGQPPTRREVQRARLARRGQTDQLLLKLDGVDDRNAAEALRGALVQVPESQAWKLPRGRFYQHQIVGLQAISTHGRHLGQVRDVLETGANDVYVVQTTSGELLLPAVKDVVKEISPERGVMVVELLPGMSEEP